MTSPQFSQAAISYRHLLRQTAHTEMLMELPRPGGLLQAVRARYRQVVSKNLQLPPHQRKNIAKKQQVSLYRIMNALEACPENETLSKIAVALSTGNGNEAYRSTLFRHFAETLVFDAERSRRDEVSAAAVAERQNKLMQTAVFPYLEKLCTLNDRTLQDQTSSDPMLRALAPRRAGVTLQLFPVEPHYIAVEIDETLNKQTIYISSGTEEENDYQKSILGNEHLLHRVDSAQLEQQRSTIMHLVWMNRARHCLDCLTDESGIHRARGTVVVGHGVGGAVATALAVMLQSESFPIRNLVTFGAPKVIEEIEDRHMITLNSVRVALARDPLVHTPVSGSEGGLFHHVGELLVVNSKIANEMYPLSKPSSKKPKQQETTTPNAEDDDENVDLAEMLFAELSQQESKSTTKKANKDEKVGASSNKQQRQDDEDSATRTGHETIINNNPFCVDAYRVALADPDAELEYFEEDAGVWERDEIRDANEMEEELRAERESEVNRAT